MPNYSTSAVDTVFHALAHPTRRGVLERLERGAASVTALAEPFDMALPSFLQHIRVLEESGLVRTRKEGRVRTVEVVPAGARPAREWLHAQASLWETRLDQLDDYLTMLQENDGVPDHD